MSSAQASTAEVKPEKGDTTDVQTDEQSNEVLLEPMQNTAEEQTSGIEKPKRRRKRNSTKLPYSARKMREMRSKETFLERQARLERGALRASMIRAMETPEQKMKRNAYHRERMRRRRQAQKFDRAKEERKPISTHPMNCLQEMDYNTRKKNIIELHEQGLSVDSIAKKLKFTSRTVFKILSQYQMEKIAAESEVYVIDDDSNDECNTILPDSTGSSNFGIAKPSQIYGSPNLVQILGQNTISTHVPLQPQISMQINPSTIQNSSTKGTCPPLILNPQFHRGRGIKRKQKAEKPDGEAIVNKQGEKVGVYRRIRNIPVDPQKPDPLNSSLELGLKILAAAVPPEVHETLLGKGVIPAAPKLGKKRKTQGTATPTMSFPAQPEEITDPTFSVRNVTMTTIQNALNNKGVKITSVESNVQEENKNLIMNTSQPIYHFHGDISQPGLQLQPVSQIVPGAPLATPVVMTPPSTIPKITAVHSQFTPEVLTDGVKVNKLHKVIKDIEDNPVMYLGVGREELCILSFLARCLQIHKKQIYVIFRKMRQNESVEILSDVFEMPLEEVVTTIIEIIPKMATLFRKAMKVASKRAPTDCALTRMSISVRKPNYMNDHPEEISRYSVRVDLYYLISCTHEGFVNFVSKGFDGNSKYSSSDAVFNFVKFTKPPAVHVIGDGFGKVDLDVLKWKRIDVKIDASICYKMNVMKALDDIKIFKILANSEVPLRYEFFKIIDDLVIVATMLHNIRLQ